MRPPSRMDRGKTRKKGKTDILNVPAYVINLKERPDRWKRFTDQPVVHSFKALKREPAVNGKRLNYARDKRISVRTKLNIFRNYRRSHHEIATLGAIGSSMSHIGIWKKFVESGAKVCLVLEDDAILTEQHVENINRILPTLPSKWGMWILGWYRPNLVREPLPTKPWNRVYNFTAAHAYLLTRDAAIKLLEEPFPIEKHIEYYITSCSILKDFLILQHPEMHIEFFRKERGPRTADSNTSQHKKAGCPSCNAPDDYSQLYKKNSRKTTDGMVVQGLVNGEQSKRVLTLLRGATRKNSKHP